VNGPVGAGRLVLVELSVPELALLRGLPDQEVLSSAEMDAGLAATAESVAVVVIGSLVGSAVSLVQRAHRLVPHAGIAVLAPDPAAVHRQVSFAPGVPLDLLIGGIDDRDLPHRLQELRGAVVDRRRHAAALAAVARSATAAARTGPMGRIAVGALLEHAPIGVLVIRPSGELLGWNRRAEELMGLRPAMTGRSVDAVLPGALAMTTAAVSPARPVAGSDVAPPLLNVGIGDRAVEISAVSSETDQGRPVVLLLAIDVTAQHRAERERDRLVGHVELLGRISASLMHSLDVSVSLSRLAGALVPALADWVGIQVLAERDRLDDVVVRHRDPGLAPVTREAEQLTRSGSCLTEASRRAAGGEHVLLPRVASDGLVAQVPDAELRSLVERLGMGSAIAVPIPGRECVLGSLLLANGPDGGVFVEADLALAVEIGRRAGVALDNGRLYAGQRHVATELQQSLLTAPPALPFADIAVRYVAAAQEAQVGGDWYDAFRQHDGALTVVIGDVVGHDTRAAATMGQLRSLVRGIAFTTANAPGQVLTAVDEAIDGLALATIASAVVAHVSPLGDGHGVNGARLRWSNAGHPPPVLLDAEGRSRVLTPGTGRADLLLGIDAATRRTTEQVVLPPGSTLLLYTDGLVERRGESLDDGLDRLRSTVERHADEALDRLCDAILSSMVPQAGEDDVAIVAVRPRAVSAQTRPRDPTGGP
jgi:serine phosphatase RsbU (regulator of sigma subunit)/PAS domain-containing protein